MVSTPRSLEVSLPPSSPLRRGDSDASGSEGTATSENSEYVSASLRDPDMDIYEDVDPNPSALDAIGLRRDRVNVIYLVSHPDLQRIGKALVYSSEHARASCVFLVHFCKDECVGDCRVRPMWHRMRGPLQHLHPEMIVELVIINDRAFSPQAISTVAIALAVDSNFIFFRAPGRKFGHHLAEFV
jgi:hypothetical protein